MAPKDSRYTSIDLQKLGRWTDRHERIKNGKVDAKRGIKVNVEFENDIWEEKNEEEKSGKYCLNRR
jgi:hypothetical protein